jgi:hypothetical protein
MRRNHLVCHFKPSFAVPRHDANRSCQSWLTKSFDAKSLLCRGSPRSARSSLIEQTARIVFSGLSLPNCPILLTPK